jgi:hypothetical protein
MQKHSAPEGKYFKDVATYVLKGRSHVMAVENCSIHSLFIRIFGISTLQIVGNSYE